MKNSCGLLSINYIHRTHKNGTFYMLPSSMPFILHDLHGCVFIDRQYFERLVNDGIFKISHSRNGDKINVKNGIYMLNEYKKCDFEDKCPKASFK